MRIAHVAALSYENPTAESLLKGLAKVYAGPGRRVKVFALPPHRRAPIRVA
jgi:hypothetical protein